jgi:hypothetical protein
VDLGFRSKSIAGQAVSMAARVLSQATVSLTTAFVTICAAQSFSTGNLGKFLVAWNISALWLALLRTSVGTAYLHALRVPSNRSLLRLAPAAGVPAAGVSGLLLIALLHDWRLGLLAGVTVVLLGTYEVSRYIRIREQDHAGGSSIVLTDAFCLFGAAASGTILITAGLGELISSLMALSFGASVGIAMVALSAAPVQDADHLVTWAITQRPLLIAGATDWFVFAVSGQAGVYVLTCLSYSEYVAGIRLAQMLLTPVSITLTAIPLTLASRTSAASGAGQGGRRMIKYSFAATLLGATAWILALYLTPRAWLSVVLGDSADLAFTCLAGLLIGVPVTVASVHYAVWLRATNRANSITRSRVANLPTEPTLVTAGALAGGGFESAAGVGLTQVVGAGLLFLSGRADRSAAGASMQASVRTFS